MTKSVLLNNIEHKDLRVIPARGANYGDAVNQVPVVPSEFLFVQREFPILIKRNADNELQPYALLGFDKGENLFLRGDAWAANYIPALLERGAFMIGLQKREENGEVQVEPMIHVDLEHPSISYEEGYPLFLPQGGNAPYLEHISGILRTLHAGLEMRKPLFDALEKFDLIEPITINVEVNRTLSYNLPDFLTVSVEKLADLDGESLKELNQAGHLYAAHLIMSSVSNINRLISLKNQKISAEEQANRASQ